MKTTAVRGTGPVSVERFYAERACRNYSGPEDVECPLESWVYYKCPNSQTIWPCKVHTQIPVIAIDGACSNNGKDGARSAIGVYFGEDNEHNRSAQLAMNGRHTSQVAELKACIYALAKVFCMLAPLFLPDEPELECERQMSRPHSTPQGVMIKSDSEYVVRGVTEWLPKWKSNGWKSSRGRLVANADEFKELDRILGILNAMRVDIKFWLVPRQMNEVADYLAKSALYK